MTTDGGGVHTINKTTQRLEKPKLRNNKKDTTEADNTQTETEADNTQTETEADNTRTETEADDTRTESWHELRQD